ncbi:TetR/AcrR family transcriptional regulator [Microtetraspora malaysiensis]|uniref:TetR/AcrR family transcriptional regulator n=1 Tax=Microtetraspora malaysiensis TaxID=161358 RepID=UPI003D8F06C3
MGNREDLLAGAKRCLYEKGYTRTTARDIAAASGTSLASIGYHFRSTKALLNEALVDTMREWGDELERALGTDTGMRPGSQERFEAIWERVVGSFTERRPLWATQFEVITQLDHLPEMREAFGSGLEEARYGLAEIFDPDADPETLRVTGRLYQTLLSGLLSQWLIDPEHAPTGRDLAAAIRAVAAGFDR